MMRGGALARSGVRLARRMSGGGGPSKEALEALEKAEAVMREHQARLAETKAGEAFYKKQFYAGKAITTPAVEEWMVFRENMEQTFRWTPSNIFTVGMFCVVVPYYAYKMVTDEIEGRPAHLPFGILIDNPLKGPIERIGEGAAARDRERERAGLPVPSPR